MKLKPYQKYKDSGTQWIGEIPENWEINRLKFLSKGVITGKTPPSDKEEYYNDGEINWYAPGDLSEEFILIDSNKKITPLAIRETNMKVYPENAVLMVGIGATLGKVGIIQNKSTSNQQINTIIFDNCINPKFGLYYLYGNKEPIVALSNASTIGILNQSQTKDLIFLTPSINTQNGIVKFIDLKILEIKKLIEKDKQLIELLKEKRTALINHAVTKGLNPKAKMKDSGIEWIGEVPEGWEVKRLKRVCSFKYGSSLSEEERTEGEVYVYGSNGIVGTHNKLR